MKHKWVNQLMTPVEQVFYLSTLCCICSFSALIQPTGRLLMSHPARNQIKVPTGLPLAAKGNLHQNSTVATAKEKLLVCTNAKCCLFSCDTFLFYVDCQSRSRGTVGQSKMSFGCPDTSVSVCIFRRAALFQLGRCFIWSRPAAWRVSCTCLTAPLLCSPP